MPILEPIEQDIITIEYGAQFEVVRLIEVDNLADYTPSTITGYITFVALDPIVNNAGFREAIDNMVKQGFGGRLMAQSTPRPQGIQIRRSVFFAPHERETFGDSAHALVIVQYIAGRDDVEMTVEMSAGDNRYTVIFKG